MDRKKEIIEALNILQKSDKAAGKVFEARAYQTAITSMKALPAITAVADVAGLKGVGKKIQEKVAEILATGSLRAAENARSKPEFSAYDALLNVYGVGPVKAKALVADGVTSIEELRRRSAADPDLLTAAQKLGLQYYEDALERIPRAEIMVHETALRSVFEPRGLKMEVVGSYRRGQVDSGDIDVLITAGSPAMTEAAMRKAFKEGVEALVASEYIVGILAKGATKTLAFSRVGAAARRLDLLLTPPAEYPYAILYFTGSQGFNIGMRGWALTRGYTMNEHGMAPTVDTAAAVPAMDSEEDIFAFLGLKYIGPTERTGADKVVAVAGEAAGASAPVPALASASPAKPRLSLKAAKAAADAPAAAPTPKPKLSLKAAKAAKAAKEESKE